MQSGISLYDTMQIVLPDVCTLVLGLAASVASLILAGGAISKRVALPHARVMIHQPFTTRFSAAPKQNPKKIPNPKRIPKQNPGEVRFPNPKGIPKNSKKIRCFGLEAEAEQMFQLRNTIAGLYVESCGQSFDRIQEDLERKKYMSATEAQAYRIVDYISKEREWK